MQKTVAFHTLGCRLNFSETGTIADGFRQRGYDIVDFGQKADVVFVNTCTVTDKADSTCRNLIRKAHSSSPEGKIVVAGCYAQMEPEAISRMQGVDLVLGTHEKYKVFDYLKEESDLAVHVDKHNTFWGAATTVAEGHTRAFLKIQDGCNYVCSFCIIPQARGRSRAMALSECLDQARATVEQGFKEIVLTGVNIGEYEAQSGEKLTDLLKGLAEIQGLERIRLSSVEPNTLSDDLLEVMLSSSKFLPHFHVPLQSGDDEILRNMRRKYDVKFYSDLIWKLKEKFPTCGIGADMITGFPGETEEQFKNTFNLVKDLPLTHFHVFPYSKRKNTTAATREDHIPFDVRKSRSRSLIMLGEAKLRAFAEEFEGTTTDVLFEKKNKKGLWEGYTPNFIRVNIESEQDLKNQILPVALLKAEKGILLGSLLN